MASILITGATDALGLALAAEIAGAGHQLLLHGRNPQRPVPVAQRFGAEQYIADLSARPRPSDSRPKWRHGTIASTCWSATRVRASPGTAPSETCQQTDIGSGWR